MRVGLLGWGALGSAIGAAVADGEVPGATLAAIGLRREAAGLPATVVAPAELAVTCDVVVEAAGQPAVRDHVPGLLHAGLTVMVLSTGALRDAELLDELRPAGERLVLSTGAIGGLDIIGACRRIGHIQRVELQTTKPPAVLIQPWMARPMQDALRAGQEVVECFRGPAGLAAERFPSSVNVAASLALAAGGWDLVDVTVIADPAATGNRHRIQVTADAGTYAIDVVNNALPANPASSALVVGSALRGLAALAPTEPRFL